MTTIRGRWRTALTRLRDRPRPTVAELFDRTAAQLLLILGMVALYGGYLVLAGGVIIGATLLCALRFRVAAIVGLAAAAGVVAMHPAHPVVIHMVTR